MEHLIIKAETSARCTDKLFYGDDAKDPFKPNRKELLKSGLWPFGGPEVEHRIKWGQTDGWQDQP